VSSHGLKAEEEDSIHTQEGGREGGKFGGREE
jgi:hypothetical protein